LAGATSTEACGGGAGALANESAEVRSAMVVARLRESGLASAGARTGDWAQRCACPRSRKPTMPMARAAAARAIDSRRPRYTGASSGIVRAVEEHVMV